MGDSRPSESDVNRVEQQGSFNLVKVILVYSIDLYSVEYIVTFVYRPRNGESTCWVQTLKAKMGRGDIQKFRLCLLLSPLVAHLPVGAAAAGVQPIPKNPLKITLQNVVIIFESCYWITLGIQIVEV